MKHSEKGGKAWKLQNAAKISKLNVFSRLLDKCTQSFRSFLKFKENNNTLEIILVIVPKKVSNTGLSLDIVLTLEKLANHKYNE